MQRINVELVTRDLGNKEELNLNQLRKKGYVPAILYGHGKPQEAAVEIRLFKKVTHTDAGINALFNVKYGGKTNLSIIKEVQRDIFTQDPIHVDFMRINTNEKIDVNIPIHLEGEPEGVKNESGILEQIQREMHIRCLPDKIPPHIDIDVAKLKIHDQVKVDDVKVESGVEILTPGDHIIAHVVAPRVEEEPAPAVEGAESTEPEVISKGKKEEEEAGGETTGKASAEAKPDKK